MKRISRRQLLKTGVAACAASALPTAAMAATVGDLREGGLATSPDAIFGNPSLRSETLLDAGWRFRLGDADVASKDLDFGRMCRELQYAKNGNLIPAAIVGYDDANWREVDLPHDWAVELPFLDAPYLPEHGGKPIGREYPETSIGWYRKNFTLGADDAEKRVLLRLDGLFRHGLLMLNGMYLGETWSGYAPYTFDLTDMLNATGPNVLLVRVDATLGEGWFYEGAGIYRHVCLVKTAPIHLGEDSAVVRSKVEGKAAKLFFECEVVNESAVDRECVLHVEVAGAEGGPLVHAASVKVAVPAGETRKLAVDGALAAAKLWSVEEPHLYHATFRVETAKTAGDEQVVSFGVRTVEFDAEQGFFLNGKNVKIKGTCNHHDFAGVGVALPDCLHSYRVKRLQAMGSNAIRTSHNPPSRELLETCDRLGMMVMAETRLMSSSQEGLYQLETMVKRYRNHPSVVIWSLGNEEREQSTLHGERMAATMRATTRRLDSTRVVTVAMNGDWGKGVSNSVDVQGCNYNEYLVDDFHKKFPEQPMIGTETASTLSTRGEYANDRMRGYVSAYDVNVPDWGATAEKWWKFYDARPFLSGGFVWTGFDYRGEPTPYSWPCISSHFGVLDTCGFPKDNFYYYKAWWGKEPVLHLYPHWDWPGKEGTAINVWVQSNLDEVELLVNGTSLGTKKVERLGHLQWNVPYAAGFIEAIGKRDGKIVLKESRETTGKPASIRLTPDRPAIDAAGSDVSVVAVEILDAKGRLVSTASNKVAFSVSAPGKILGVGNGDPSCHEADKASARSAFNGLCMVLVQSTGSAGEVVLAAKADGLEAATTTIRIA